MAGERRLPARVVKANSRFPIFSLDGCDIGKGFGQRWVKVKAGPQRCFGAFGAGADAYCSKLHAIEIARGCPKECQDCLSGEDACTLEWDAPCSGGRIPATPPAFSESV